MIKRIVFIFTLFAALAFLTSCQDDQAKAKKRARLVKSIVVKKSNSEVVRNFPGKVLASREVYLSFQVPGKVIKLPVLEGDVVKKNQLLAQLEDTKYREAFNEAEARFIREKAHYKRAVQLVKKLYISEAEYDNKRANYLSAKSKLNAAKKDLNDTIMRAPFNGVVSIKYIDNFEYIKAKQKIFKFQNLNQIDIEINVPENVMVNLRKDSNQNHALTVIFDSVPKKTYVSTFKEYSAEADPETQTYRVILTMPAPKDINILPGMTATIRVKLPDFKSGGKSFIQIPSSAVFSDQGKHVYVWLIDPKTSQVKKQAVTVSRMANDTIHVLSGIKVGDRIVTAGVHYLQEHEQVRLMDVNDNQKAQ